MNEESRILFESAGQISSEYALFVVRAESAGLSVEPWDGNTLVTVPPAARMDGEFWVNTGNQWGPWHVTVRLLDAAPGPAAEIWEDVVELSVATTSRLGVTELIDNEPWIELVAEPGEYRLRVSARGRTANPGWQEADDDHEQPNEWYLIEAWPAPAANPDIIRLRSSFAEQLLNPPPALVIPEAEAALAAASRIGRDVDRKPGARTLSGEVGSASAERTIRGTRRKLFKLCAYVSTWSHIWIPPPSWFFQGATSNFELGEPSWAFSGTHRDQLTGEFGGIQDFFLEVESPARAVRSWRWFRQPSPEQLSPDDMLPVHPDPTILTVTLTQQRDPDGDVWTTIRFVHDGLPLEWVEDMRIYWEYQLSIADHARLGLRK